MLPSSLERISTAVPDDALVLDIGGWGRPLARANWVMDLMPYETRGLYGREDPAPERFDASTWIERDICDRQPYPFAEGAVDFVVCSHTLEDIRDPIWVCSEMNRIAKAGYIEVPSRLEEQSFGIQGPWVGWGHHRWLIEVLDDGRIEFVFKHHVMHGRRSDHFPPDFHASLAAEDRVQTLWWERSFDFGERVLMSADEVDPYLADFVARHRGPEPQPKRRGLLRRLTAEPRPG